jgi:ParB family chromosome partitioning protein
MGRCDESDLSPADCSMIPIEKICFDIDHIRRVETSIEGLKYTISDMGLIQPIVVRRSGETYTVIDGQRRLMALRQLNLPELIMGREVIIAADETEADYKFKQIIVNIQREDINPIDLGQAFVMLKEKYGYQYNEIAEIVGKTPHYITSKVGLAKRLTPDVQELVISDWRSSSCIRDTFSTEDDGDQPVEEMNIKVIEDIARLPEDLQKTAYLMIRSKEMQTDQALKYLRSMKKGGKARNRPGKMGTTSGLLLNGASPYEDLVIYIEKLDRDVDELADRLQMADQLNRQELAPKIEATLEKLSSLYVKLKSEASGGHRSSRTDMMVSGNKECIRARYS